VVTLVESDLEKETGGASLSTIDLLIRPATGDDADAIAAIYNDAVATSTATFDLGPETVAQRRRWLAADGTRLCLVAELDRHVVGWSALVRWSARAGYDHTAEAAIYVAAGRRRAGVGRALLEAVIAGAPALDLHAVIVQICAENEPGLALAAALGFVRVGTLREVGLKFGRRLDVTICERLV
jgi:L-amino acid N-acyltransferase